MNRHVCGLTSLASASGHSIDWDILCFPGVAANTFPATVPLMDFSMDRQRRRRPCTNHEGRYQCSFCAYRTDYQTNLIAHQRTHTGERPFRCNFCAKGFAQKSNLKSHMKRHITDAVARWICRLHAGLHLWARHWTLSYVGNYTFLCLVLAVPFHLLSSTVKPRYNEYGYNNVLVITN